MFEIIDYRFRSKAQIFDVVLIINHISFDVNFTFKNSTFIPLSVLNWHEMKISSQKSNCQLEWGQKNN